MEKCTNVLLIVTIISYNRTELLFVGTSLLHTILDCNSIHVYIRVKTFKMPIESSRKGIAEIFPSFLEKWFGDPYNKS